MTVPPVRFLTVAVLSVVPGISARPEIVQVSVSPAVRYEPETAHPDAIDAAFHVTPTGKDCEKTTSPPPGTLAQPHRYVIWPPVTGTKPFVVLESDAAIDVSSPMTLSVSPVAVAAVAGSRDGSTPATPRRAAVKSAVAWRRRSRKRDIVSLKHYRKCALGAEESSGFLCLMQRVRQTFRYVCPRRDSNPQPFP